MRVLLNLVCRLAHRYATALQFDMKERQPIDEKQHVPAPVACQRMRRREIGLTDNLVETAPGSDFVAVEDVQRNGSAAMQRVGRIVSRDRHFFSVHPLVRRQRRWKRIDLVYDLTNLRLRQFYIVQTIDISIVEKQNARKICAKVCFCRTLKHIRQPCRMRLPAIA